MLWRCCAVATSTSPDDEELALRAIGLGNDDRVAPYGVEESVCFLRRLARRHPVLPERLVPVGVAGDERDAAPSTSGSPVLHGRGAARLTRRSSCSARRPCCRLSRRASLRAPSRPRVPETLGERYGASAPSSFSVVKIDRVGLGDVRTAEPGLLLLCDACEEAFAARLVHGHVDLVRVLEGVRQLGQSRCRSSCRPSPRLLPRPPVPRASSSALRGSGPGRRPGRPRGSGLPLTNHLHRRRREPRPRATPRCTLRISVGRLGRWGTLYQ